MTVHFSSGKDDWRTPVGFLNQLAILKPAEFDPCPDPAAPDWVCANHTPIGVDGTQAEWPAGKHAFINPPYSQLSGGAWTSKILSYCDSTLPKQCCTVLVPSRTDTTWWQALAAASTAVFFIKGRLKFHGAKNSAPFPSCILSLGYSPNVKQWAECFRAIPFEAVP
jgi:site-specific DNA-methyltransferase (adenine-specific)